MTPVEKITTLVILVVGLAAAWLIGKYLYAVIGVWGGYIGVLIVIATFLYITSKPELKDFFVVPVFALMITIAWIISRIAEPFIGFWCILVGIIVFLLELAVIMGGLHLHPAK